MISTSVHNLDAALEAFELDAAHRPLVRQIALRAGIVECEVKASYVKLIRIDGMHPLHVTRRGVEWFSSRVEAVSASGLPDRVRGKANRAGTENWGVTFPEVEVPAVALAADDATVAEAPPSPAPARRSATPTTAERDHGVCERCWQARTAAGTCGCDD